MQITDCIGSPQWAEARGAANAPGDRGDPREGSSAAMRNWNVTSRRRTSPAAARRRSAAKRRASPASPPPVVAKRRRGRRRKSVAARRLSIDLRLL